MKQEASKWLPILLSVTAVTISCLSLWEAHRGRIIQEGINRPQLRVENATVSTFLGWFSFDLRNVGKLPAKITKLTFIQERHEVNGEVFERCVMRQKLLDTDTLITSDVSEVGEIFPGDSQFMRETIQTAYLLGCENDESIDGKISVEYQNSLTGELYSQLINIEVQISVPSFKVEPSPSP